MGLFLYLPFLSSRKNNRIDNLILLGYNKGKRQTVKRLRQNLFHKKCEPNFDRGRLTLLSG